MGVVLVIAAVGPIVRAEIRGRGPVDTQELDLGRGRIAPGIPDPETDGRSRGGRQVQIHGLSRRYLEIQVLIGPAQVGEPDRISAGRHGEREPPAPVRIEREIGPLEVEQQGGSNGRAPALVHGAAGHRTGGIQHGSNLAVGGQGTVRHRQCDPELPAFSRGEFHLRFKTGQTLTFQGRPGVGPLVERIDAVGDSNGANFPRFRKLSQTLVCRGRFPNRSRLDLPRLIGFIVKRGEDLDMLPARFQPVDVALVQAVAASRRADGLDRRRSVTSVARDPDVTDGTRQVSGPK